MEHVFLNTLKIGDKVEGVYYVQEIVEKLATNKNKYSDVTIKDKTGSKVCKYWDSFGLQENISGFFAHLKMRVDSYQNTPSLVIEEIEACASPENQENYAEFYSTQKADIEYLKKVVEFLSKSADKNPECKDLLKSLVVYNDTSLPSFEIVKNCPYINDMKLGGLLANTAKITSIAVKMADAYLIPLKEKCILLTACMVHGLGLPKYFSLESFLEIKENNVALLFGSKQLTINYLNEIYPQKNNIVERLMHCILTDNITVKPVTREAVIYNEVMRMHNTISNSLNFINADTTEGEFTAFETNMKRKFFK